MKNWKRNSAGPSIVSGRGQPGINQTKTHRPGDVFRASLIVETLNRHPFNTNDPGRHWAFGRQSTGASLETLSTQGTKPSSGELAGEPSEESCFGKPFFEEPAVTADEVRTEPLANLEAVLFVAREPLSGRRLVQLAELPEGIRIRPMIRQLNELYDKRQSAFRVIEVASGFQLRTRPEFAPWLVRLQEVPVTVRLSGPAMETLAVIAYRQPVLRADIERIRGVQCGELIRQLLDRDLVRIVGRSEELGRPFFYGTTRTFLEVFGLGSLKDLPDRELLALPETFVPEESNEEEETG